MVLCAALKIEIRKNNEVKTLILHCRRHGDGYAFLARFGTPADTLFKVIEQGFICTDGRYLNRKEAYDHARECGQLNASTLWYKTDHNDDDLYSEDLY
jgi:hypothetical protein